MFVFVLKDTKTCRKQDEIIDILEELCLLSKIVEENRMIITKQETELKEKTRTLRSREDERRKHITKLDTK